MAARIERTRHAGIYKRGRPKAVASSYSRVRHREAALHPTATGELSWPRHKTRTECCRVRSGVERDPTL